MDFHALHGFAVPPERVAAKLTDPDFYLALDLPDVSRPELLEAGDGLLRLRYEFTGTLDPLARSLLGGRRLAWSQEIRLAPGGGGGELHFAAEADATRMHGAARFTLEPAAPGTIRRLEGSITVAVPFVGPMAERRIVPGLLRRLDAEAAALDCALAARPEGL